MYYFIDFSNIPAERLTVIFIREFSLASQFFVLGYNLVVLLLEIVLEDTADALEFLPVVDSIVLKGGEIDSRVIESCYAELFLFGSHM